MPIKFASVGRFIAATTALILLCTTFGPAQTALVPLTVAPILSSDQVPFFYALQQGLFKNAGLDVSVAQATSGSAALTSVVANGAQIGYCNPLSLVVAFSKGIPIELVAPGQQYDSNNAHAKLLVAANSPIASAKDLEGRVIGITGLRDLLALAVAAYMAAAGADSTKIRYVEMPGGAMLAALQAQRVDAIMIYEPFMSSAESSGATRMLAKPLDAISPNFAAGAWFALGPWAKAHRDAVARFARVMSQASAYSNTHYDDLIPTIASYSKMPVETLTKIVRFKIPPSVAASAFQPVIDVAAKYHEIPTAFRAQEMMQP
jgi:NitT/TauT family transport system substrate-binding protein